MKELWEEVKYLLTAVIVGEFYFALIIAPIGACFVERWIVGYGTSYMLMMLGGVVISLVVALCTKISSIIPEPGEHKIWKITDYVGLSLIIVTAMLLAFTFPISNIEIISEEYEEVPISSSVRYETVSYLSPGETKTVLGESGRKKNVYEIHKKLFGGQVMSRERIKEEIIEQPQDTIIYKGQEQRAMPKAEPYYENDSGASALCWDNTYSYSTGRGTCSHHGGVKSWL